MLAALALLAPWGGIVSYATDAAPVKVIVADLARQSGLHLQCASDLAAEPVIADFKDRPTDEVLNKLAEVLGAEWTTRNDVRILERPPDLKAKQQTEERAKLVAAFNAMLSDARKQIATLPKFDAHEAELTADRVRLVDMKPEAEEAEHDRLAKSNPASRAIIAIFSADPSRLLRTEIGSRVVLSTVPTQLQLGIPSAAMPVIDQLKTQIRLVEEAKARIDKVNKPFINYADLPQFGPATSLNGFGKVVIAVNRTGTLSFSYHLMIVDPDGRSILQCESYFPSLVAPIHQAHHGETLKLSEDTKRFAILRNFLGASRAMSINKNMPDGSIKHASFAISMAEKAGRNPGDDVKEILGDPVGRDPLGVLIGGPLRQVAAVRPLLATFSDGAIGAVGAAIARDQLVTQDDLMSILTTPQGIPFSETLPGDWLALRPYVAVLARKSRIDRVALKGLVASIRSEGAITIPDAARYVATAPRMPSFGTLDWYYAVRANTSIDENAANYVFNSALPLLASITPAQWTAFDRGALTLGDLAPNQREIVRKWVYDELLFESSVPEREMAGFQRIYPLEIEPTEIFADGLPLSTQILVKATSKPAILTRSASGFAFMLDPESLGLFEAYRDDPDRHPEAANRQLLDYRPASKVGYSVEVDLTPKIKMKLTAEEHRPNPNTAPGPRERLPADVLKRVDAAKAAFAGM